MLKLKKYLIIYLLFIILFSLGCFLYYYGILNSLLFKLFKFILIMLMFMIQSFLAYKEFNNYKFILGLCPSFVLIFIFLISSIIFNEFNFKILFYFMILILSSLFGIFINKKKA